MTTILFFDDQPLDRMDNVARRVGNPELIPESVYIDPDVNTHFGFPTVFQDEASGKWRVIHDGRNTGEPNPWLMAESDDGIHWSPRDTTAELDLPDRKHRHQILPILRDGRPNSFVDHRAEPAERIKSLVGRADPYMLVSPDGLHWTRRESRWHNIAPPDPPTCVFWNDVRQSYVLTTRPEGGDRRISVSETKDWTSFTTPELALQCDPLDAPLTQIYGMPVIPYEGIYIGLVWLFHCIPEPPNKYLGGHVDVQLAYSLNGWHFQRGPREPFIPNGEPGQPDSGCVYPFSWVTQADGSLRIYASACTLEHGNTPAGDAGSIIAYSMRPRWLRIHGEHRRQRRRRHQDPLPPGRRGRAQRPGPGRRREGAGVRRGTKGRGEPHSVLHIAPGRLQFRRVRAILRRRHGLDSALEGRQEPIGPRGHVGQAGGAAEQRQALRHPGRLRPDVEPPEPRLHQRRRHSRTASGALEAGASLPGRPPRPCLQDRDGVDG